MIPPLQIEPVEGSPRTLRVSGELDVLNAELLASRLRELTATPGDVILDVSDLSFVDSRGLQVLIEAAQSLEGDGVLVLRHPRSLVANLLRVTQAQSLPALRIER
ncbi:MAG TPA: STAS domain-containing protein [Actinomycetota bacterium]|nr:STAS domain-containing protein [Actinomycetota bacterium]